ncbi:MAG: hypothetical protein JRJ02_08010, partial [Deltaproteobacteria bacterium]|nr:hypothetical protein [Deltaproteobacteria bacterium]
GKRTREQTKKQYQKAAATGALMVFVRDEEKEVLVKNNIAWRPEGTVTWSHRGRNVLISA